MITELITNIGIMAALTTVACEYLSKLTKAGGTWAQIQSWVIAIILAWFTSFLGLGIFPNLTWISVILYGFLVGLVANGIFDIPITKTVLEWIKARFVKQPA